MIIERAQPVHILNILPRVQPQHQATANKLACDDFFMRNMSKVGPAIAFRQGVNTLAVLGLIDNPQRSIAWVIFAADLKREAVELFRKAMHWLTVENPRKRIEIHIDGQFEPAKRLAILMGFKYEGFLENLMPDGSGRELWALGEGTDGTLEI